MDLERSALDDQKVDLSKLPPPISHLVDREKKRLSDRGEAILRALRGCDTTSGTQTTSTRERILWALMDGAYA